MNESTYQNKIKEVLDSRDAYFEVIWGGGFQAAGIPDILICYRGYFIGLELKVKNNKPSALQVAKVAMIRNAGGIGAIVWDRIEPLVFILDELDNRPPGTPVSDLNIFNTKEDSYNV